MPRRRTPAAPGPFSCSHTGASTAARRVGIEAGLDAWLRADGGGAATIRGTARTVARLIGGSGPSRLRGHTTFPWKEIERGDREVLEFERELFHGAPGRGNRGGGMQRESTAFEQYPPPPTVTTTSLRWSISTPHAEARESRGSSLRLCVRRSVRQPTPARAPAAPARLPRRSSPGRGARRRRGWRDSARRSRR